MRLRLNAALEGRYRIESELGEGGGDGLPAERPETRAESRAQGAEAVTSASDGRPSHSVSHTSA